MRAIVVFLASLIVTALAPAAGASHVSDATDHWCDTGSTACNAVRAAGNAADGPAHAGEDAVAHVVGFVTWYIDGYSSWLQCSLGTLPETCPHW